MLKSKKTARRGDCSWARLAGLTFFISFCVLSVSFYVPVVSGKNFTVSSSNNSNEHYFEENSFGTNKSGGPAFYTDPQTGDRHFRTPEMPKQDEPDDVDILPVHPEVHPVVKPPKPPIIVPPNGRGD